jgi:predicted flavoprotein YhiN
MSTPPPVQPAADVAIVGAGAAGLTAAIRAAEAGARVLLLNAHPKIGLKVLMSGGTRCNVTHREVTAADFHGGSRAVVARILRAFTPEQTRAWFESLGVELKLEPTGKYFPVTDDAHTVLEAIERRVRELGIAVRSGARVVRLERADGGYRLGIQQVADSNAFAGTASFGGAAWPLPAVEPAAWMEADRVVLSTGGLSFPRTGSDGTGYALASALGHSVVPPVPALTPLVAEDALCSAAQGLTLEAALTLRAGGRALVTVRGSLLVTHFGFSGPAALDFSREWLRAEGERTVTASFLPEETAQGLTRVWINAAAHSPHVTARRFLAARVPERLAELLCAEAGVEPGTELPQVPRAVRDSLLRLVFSQPLAISGTLGYEKAECTAGGVPIPEVNPSTLESRKAPGLYLCGEILDVEGRLGGFNFQWAWSSGTVAGSAAGSGALAEVPGAS